MIKAWTEEAWEDFEYWTTQDRKVLKRILQLLKDIDRNSYEGIGKPERLSGDLSSYWSRRIDDANRIVYRIDGNVVKIVQCGSQYKDKYYQFTEKPLIRAASYYFVTLLASLLEIRLRDNESVPQHPHQTPSDRCLSSTFEHALIVCQYCVRLYQS